MAEQLDRNPALLCLIRAMQMALFPMAILSVFLEREIGFGVAEIMLLQAVFGVAMVLFEFPAAPPSRKEASRILALFKVDDIGIL